ncbi:hypothetical protein [Rhodococcus sp. 14-2470-1a]|uniref:hypothetical protein n=1 Tax=Rhodococcus sp. 14-2470-1a TaxID=2023150 RepID=UPI000B9C7420|nr:MULTISPECIES: hypothetical protein [unclassified Rhodococcus (in: high G+C Gram-positive bacteria)]OZC59620.1 hypothetical protein CH267_05800 [Rhodococcus sp. 06-621-2]OZD63648.1 hypothetical protein CH263_15220 [Rhodococcus sp. 06-1059B-a]OZF06911.1 hypothetical protein CH300_09010 [Rhodococcus sp. 15-1154-1]OZF49739.1 hypothetical protein CH292_14435 [Rhodococcus sp. 14-2470-1a]
MATFLALVLVLGFIHVAATTYVRHQTSSSVSRLWASPYRYNYFRPDEESVPTHRTRTDSRVTADCISGT